MLDCNHQCGSCAFGAAGAATEPHNHLKGIIASLGPVPFACHHRRDGTEFEWRNGLLGFVLLSRSDRRICAGWKAAVRRNAARGLFRGPYQIVRRAVAEAAMGWLSVFTSDKESERDKAHAKHMLARQLRFLARQDVGRFKIPL